jgi:hypothetical protein
MNLSLMRTGATGSKIRHSSSTQVKRINEPKAPKGDVNPDAEMCMNQPSSVMLLLYRSTKLPVYATKSQWRKALDMRMTSRDLSHSVTALYFGIG